MSALTVDHSSHGYGWSDLVRLWEGTDAPEGCKVEIIEGIITVSPPPSNKHNYIADRIQRALYRVIPDDWGIYQTLGTTVPSRQGLFIPDLAVVPQKVLHGEGGHFVAADGAEMIVEITSPSNAATDRITKAAGYAHAGVPLYLLVDSFAPGGPTVTLYGEPKGDVYRVLSAVPFGEGIHLPAPFDLTLDTADFPVS
ncbi:MULTISPECIES: Uma2 family endonuclease [unclassified Streptomyces]|uniref:Uma2 family endonuclease n=1 Tax=unclassified Streptomyces TaxID=2593676 RepID=UPI002E319551|nr:Uma2 family endonuclease [Streptomyces sp. NBC_01268]